MLNQRMSEVALKETHVQLNCRNNFSSAKWTKVNVGSTDSILLYSGYELLDVYKERMWVNNKSKDLNIRSVQFSDAGFYKCEKTEGHIPFTEVELTVLDSVPKCYSNITSNWSRSQLSTFDMEHENITLWCSLNYNGNWKPSMTWFRETEDGSEVETDRVTNVCKENENNSTSCTTSVVVTIKYHANMNLISYKICQTIFQSSNSNLNDDEPVYNYTCLSALPNITMQYLTDEVKTTDVIAGLPGESNELKIILIAFGCILLMIMLIIFVFVLKEKIDPSINLIPDDGNSLRIGDAYATMNDIVVIPQSSSSSSRPVYAQVNKQKKTGRANNNIIIVEDVNQSSSVLPSTSTPRLSSSTILYSLVNKQKKRQRDVDIRSDLSSTSSSPVAKKTTTTTFTGIDGTVYSELAINPIQIPERQELRPAIIIAATAAAAEKPITSAYASIDHRFKPPPPPPHETTCRTRRLPRT